MWDTDVYWECIVSVLQTRRQRHSAATFFYLFIFFKRMRQTSVASYDALCVQTRPLKDPALELGHRKRLIRWPRGRGDGAPVAMTHCSHGWPHLWLKLYKIVANLYTLTWAIDLISPQCFFFFSSYFWQMWFPIFQGVVEYILKTDISQGIKRILDWLIIRYIKVILH